MKTNVDKEIYDLTADITPNTVVYPGDPTFESKIISKLGNNCCFNLSLLSFGNHTGTHIDFPGHTIEDGRLSHHYELARLSGNAKIFTVPDSMSVINDNYISGLTINAGDMVFFKTKNSLLNKQSTLHGDYVYFTDKAANTLVARDIKIVGIDYISVDSSSSEDLPVHKTFLSNDVLIVENLELANVPAGEYHVTIAPLKIPNMDGLPARVFATRAH